MTAAPETTCYARLEAASLIVGNALIERRWRIEAGRLCATSLKDLSTGREWIVGSTERASLTHQAAPTATDVSLTTTYDSFLRVEAPSLRAELRFGSTTYRFKLFDDLAAIGMQLIVPVSGSAATGSHASSIAPTGVEVDAPAGADPFDAFDVIDTFDFDHQHCWLLETRFVEQTDVNNTLVFENTWSLGTSAKKIDLHGNLFYLEHRPTRSGVAMLKEAPSPQFRPVKCSADLELRPSQLTLRGHGLDASGGDGYMQWTILYSGDRVARIASVQKLQQLIRPYVAGRDGVLLSNTWGDRSRDAAISESFICRESDAGAQIGVDVVQIDDGWQKGLTANSATRGGVWNGFWASDDRFWDAHPTRFPNGLAPVLDRLKQNRQQLGLWFAPDSSDECRNWERDADRIIELVRSHGVRHVKIDAVKMHTKLAEQRLHLFYQRVIEATDGAVTFDADVTAEVRPGYWGQVYVGTIFVENRYTDWHNYWPHQTLRNLWKLSHHVHPMRLRMEFLNNTRNADKYVDDPLAPSRYSPAALFATVMFSSPLAWFETSNASEAFREEIGDLVRVWKAHREAIFTSTVLPIGDEPDGFAWTGFVTHRTAGDLYALVFRELSDDPEFAFEVPRPGAKQIELLHGDAKAHLLADGRAALWIPETLKYAFVRVRF